LGVASASAVDSNTAAHATITPTATGKRRESLKLFASVINPSRRNTRHILPDPEPRRNRLSHCRFLRKPEG
jgi:hypothetical protein